MTLDGNQNLISYVRGDQLSVFKHPATKKYINYWHALPKIGLIPEKSELSLSGLGYMAAGAVMLESNRESTYRIRLFGTANVHRWGFEATNTVLFDYVAPQNQLRLAEIFDALHALPCGVVMVGQELYTSGQILEIETALFPVQVALGQPPILFGVMSRLGTLEPNMPDALLASAFYKIQSATYLNVGGGIPA